MAAPSAPSLVAHTDGDKVYARWKAVAGAATYKVYSGNATAPTTLQATVTADASRWFQYVYGEAADIYVRITAVNAGAQESGYSNEVHLSLTGPGRSFGQASLFPG